MSMKDFFGKPISVYTSDQAVDDGYLVDMRIIPRFNRSIVGYVTAQLMKKGYMTDNPDRSVKFNIPNLMDLHVQIMKHMKAKGKDWFYSLNVELPSGQKQKVFVAQNETGKFTVMLPEEY